MGTAGLANYLIDENSSGDLADRVREFKKREAKGASENAPLFGAMPDLGQTVRVRYTGTLDDGTRFDGTMDEGDPVEFTIGSKRMLPAFEKAVTEMRCGEKRRIRIPACDAYGEYDESLVQWFPSTGLPGVDQLKVGGFVGLSIPVGKARAKVLELNDDKMLIDLNHELAGFDLTFDIELISIIQESAIEREMHPVGCACGCGRLKESLGKN